jgi:hypothetical protein
MRFSARTGPAISSVHPVAYHDGPTALIIAASDDATEITIRHTTSC